MIFTEVFRQEWLTPTGSGIVNPQWQNDRLLPPALRFINEQFTDPSLGRFTNITEATACTLSIAAGQMTISAATGSTQMSLVRLATPLGQQQAIVEISVVNRTGTPGAFNAILLGFVRDSNNYVVINWNQPSSVFTIQVKKAGVTNFTASVSTATWGAFPTRIAISVVGNWLTTYALLSGSQTWIKVNGLDLNTAPYNLDFKAEDPSLWFPCFGFATPGTNANTLVVDDFQAGAFGGVGIRDICVVANEDGSPNFASPSVVRALASLAGASGGIAEASQGAFLIDLEKKTFTQTGVIMVARGGKTQNDHAGMMIRYPNNDQRLLMSTWGDTPTAVRILYKEVPAGAPDLMVGRNTVAAMTQLNLPVVTNDYYDPFLIRKNGLWYLAYTCSPVTPNLFFPALASSPDLVNWTDIGSDPAATRYEGTRILPFNGESYVLTGGQFNMRMYDLAMNYIGIVNCVSPGNGTTQPHAMIFPYGALHLLVTFDQTPWPTAGGLAFSWGSIQWFASPRY